MKVENEKQLFHAKKITSIIEDYTDVKCEIEIRFPQKGENFAEAKD